MAITPKDTFDYAAKRSDHFLALYDILHDSRQRNVRSDWLNSFKILMHWPQRENVVRIDGKEKKSLLILRESVGIDRESFTHNYVSELLRSSIVCVISALEKLRRDPASRPGTIIKKEIQKVVHIDFTFQKKSDIEKGAKLLGVSDFWRKVASKMPDSPTPGEVQTKLTKIAKRRNQIVHESDLILKTSAREITQREITHNQTIQEVLWVKNFVKALDQVFYE